MTSEPTEDLELLKLVAEEEHNALEAHQSRVQFIVGLLSALVAVDIAGLLQAQTLLHLSALALGPIAIVALALLGEEVSWKFYERFLRIVTMRAKLEQRLGLTARDSGALTTGYWRQEPVVPTPQIESRSRASSSAEWIESKRGTGYDGSARRLFRMFVFLGTILLILVGAGALALYIQPPAPAHPAERTLIERW